MTGDRIRTSNHGTFSEREPACVCVREREGGGLLLQVEVWIMAENVEIFAFAHALRCLSLIHI